MRKILIIALLTNIWGIAGADTQDYVKGKIILIRANIAYFDAGQKDGVAPGQNFELFDGQQIVGNGKIAWADQNISRSEPLDSMTITGVRSPEQLIAKIRLYAAQTRRGGFLNIAYFSDLNLDPAAISTPEDMMVARLIHRGLLTKDRNGQIQSDLCADYEIRDLTYTFYLNPEAKFHSGRPVTASDVAYSLELLARAPKLNRASCFVLEINGAEDFRNGIRGEISGIFIIDDKTVAITVRRPFFAFEDYLAGPAGYIIPKPGEVSSGLGVAGAGAYRLKWIDPTGLALEPDTISGQVGSLDSLRFTRFRNPQEAGLAFELGKLDMICLLGEPKIATKESYLSQNLETDTYVIVGINNRHGYQAGQDFGKALSFLLDRGSIIRVILGGAATLPNIGFSSAGHLNFPLYDPPTPDSASYYFSQIYSMPKNLTLYVNTTYPILSKVARYIEGQLQSRGIKVIEKRIDLTLPNEQLINSDMDLYLTVYIPVSDNPDCFFYPILSDSLLGKTNYLNFNDEAIQTFLENLRIESDPDRRQSLAAGLAQSIVSNPPLLFLYQPNLIVYSRTGVSGIAGGSAGYPDLRQVTGK